MKSCAEASPVACMYFDFIPLDIWLIFVIFVIYFVILTEHIILIAYMMFYIKSV